MFRKKKCPCKKENILVEIITKYYKKLTTWRTKLNRFDHNKVQTMYEFK